MQLSLDQFANLKVGKFTIHGHPGKKLGNISCLAVSSVQNSFYKIYIVISGSSSSLRVFLLFTVTQMPPKKGTKVLLKGEREEFC